VPETKARRADPSGLVGKGPVIRPSAVDPRRSRPHGLTVRFQVCGSLQTVAFDCIQGIVQWFESRHAREETGSGRARHQRDDRAGRMCVSGHGGAKFSIPAALAACFTISQRTFGVIRSPQILPALLMGRKIRPSLIPLASVQLSIASFTQTGIGTVRMCPAFLCRSAMTQCSSRS
jgi:hypothetical protein